MSQKTYIAIVLDRSGSMSASRAATLKGLNEQIGIIRKDAEEPGTQTFVSFYTFNRHVEPKYICKSVNFLEDVSEEDYVTEGDTAMYDAVGQAIADLKQNTDVAAPGNSYLVIVVSDGAERCSTKFTKTSLAKMIRECLDQKPVRWTFTYLGANQDLSKVAESLGISKGNVANYSATARGSSVGWAHTNRNLGNYLKARKVGVTALKSFHSNDGDIADYTKVDMNAVPDTFDYKTVNLESAKPGESVDVDSFMKANHKELPKALWRSDLNNNKS